MRALLNFGRPAELRAVPTVLATAVRPIVDQLRPRCLTQGVRVEVRVPDDLPAVELDPARFEEALLCLAGNALDAMAAKRRPTLAARPVEVEGAEPCRAQPSRTAGPASPPAVRGARVEPFFTTKPGGTGLGLAVALTAGSKPRGAGCVLDSSAGRRDPADDPPTRHHRSHMPPDRPDRRRPTPLGAAIGDLPHPALAPTARALRHGRSGAGRAGPAGPYIALVDHSAARKWTDFRPGGRSGERPETLVVVMTAYSSVPGAVAALAAAPSTIS